MKRYCLEGDCGYYETAIMPSGQTIRIEFQESASKRRYYYNIYLVISDKRKNADMTYGHTTGKDGLRGLLWAKKKILEFETFIREQRPRYRIVVYCSWSDNRRRDVYARGLADIGYSFGRVFGYKVLMKVVQ